MMGAAFYGFKEAVAGASCDRLSFFATIFLSPLRLFPDGLPACALNADRRESLLVACLFVYSRRQSATPPYAFRGKKYFCLYP
jgi:hypothetical protein